MPMGWLGEWPFMISGVTCTFDFWIIGNDVKLSRLSHGNQESWMFMTPLGYAAVSAAAAKSHQSCPTLCDPTDGSPPGSSVPGILQARMLEWVAISFSPWLCRSLKFFGICWYFLPWKGKPHLPPRFGAGKVQRAGSSCPDSHLLCDCCHCSPVLKLFCRLWKQTLNCIVILQESIGEEPLSSQYSAWELLCASLVSWEI